MLECLNAENAEENVKEGEESFFVFAASYFYSFF